MKTQSIVPSSLSVISANFIVKHKDFPLSIILSVYNPHFFKFALCQKSGTGGSAFNLRPTIVWSALPLATARASQTTQADQRTAYSLAGTSWPRRLAVTDLRS